MEKYIKKLKNIKENQEGFSLIELVVAVGILAILSVVGLVAYSKITENARMSAAQAAAADVYKGAVAYDANGDPDAVQKAIDEWTNSAGNDSITFNTTGEGDNLCIIATMPAGADNKIEGKKGPGCENEGTVVVPGDNGTGGETGGSDNENGGDTGGETTTPPVIEEPFVAEPRMNVDVYSMDGMIQDASIRVSGKLPAGTTIQYKLVEVHPEEYLNLPTFTNLEVIENNNFYDETAGYGMWNHDTTYSVVSDGDTDFNFNLDTAAYSYMNVFVEIQLPEGEEFEDGTTTRTYNQVPEVQEW